ncbi:hypothetical protein [Pseudonocardia sp. KRD291]|uniref:hypothetical protein n=1 Tax=Pseudonocardia sp. KRD291 TaxID=2792007 RepID=UPI001C4A67CB|nr:hypothetical protein [Pseudonocardia sp. KRD291]MBW0102989.1 hypothetical protein [Pseudonocardia sp. KRD291]
MESDDAGHADEPVPEIAMAAGDEGTDPDDPRARWRAMPAPVRPDTWVADHDPDPLPESLQAAEAEREGRERWHVIQYGGGGGAGA